MLNVTLSYSMAKVGTLLIVLVFLGILLPYNYLHGQGGAEKNGQIYLNKRRKKLEQRSLENIIKNQYQLRSGLNIRT